MRRNLYLPSSILVEPPNPPLPIGMSERKLDAHRGEWLKQFTWANPEAVLVAARLFPLTDAKTFARWVSIRTEVPDNHTEPISQDEPNRYSIEPVLDPEMLEFRELVEVVHWIFSEIDLSADSTDYKNASKVEKRLIDYVLGFFSVGDHLVVDQLDAVASKHIRSKEGQFYLTAQENQEKTHERAYARQVREIIGVERRDELFDSIRSMSAVGKMADWMRWWAVADHPTADQITAMAFAEGVLFSGFFAALQYFRTKNKFPGLTAMNELISRDEGIHTSFWCFVARKRLAIPPSSGSVAAIAAETVNLSDVFFTEAMPDGMPGMSAKLLNQYVKFIADAVVNQVKKNAPPLFGVDNPFDSMDIHAGNRVAKTNFFESRPTAYQAIKSLAFKINRDPVDF